MIYELRTYTCSIGTFEKLRDRFKLHALKLFSKHGIQLIGFWETSGHPSGQFVYICQFQDKESMYKAWDSFSKDIDWIDIKVKTEKKGPLIDCIESKVLNEVNFFSNYLPFKG
jgi:phosphopantetheinyl transferase (holo-ACP synthase)